MSLSARVNGLTRYLGAIFRKNGFPNSFKQHCVSSFNLGIEIAFLINATSKNAGKAFNLMTRSIKKFVDKHGDDNSKYQVVIHGDDPSLTNSKGDIDKLELERGTTKIPALHEDLKRLKNADFLIRSSEKTEKVTKCDCYLIVNLDCRL